MERLRAMVLATCCAATIAASVAACGARPPVRERAQIRFLLQPATARVYEEDRFVGAARLLRRRPATFSAGPHQLTITAEGYFPHDVEVDLPPGLTTIRLRLRPIPP